MATTRTTNRSTAKESPAAEKKPAARSIRKPAAARSTVARAKAAAHVTPEQRQQYIAEAAYFIAEQRGFAGGLDLDDWLKAEAQIERLLDAETTH